MNPAFVEAGQRDIPELGTRAKRFRHVRTGADVLFLLNAEAARSCAIAVRTPPEDSTGVAHVLEHCVLSGSQTYPVGKPFDEMLKGSLQSYLNASTFPDFTIYPVASPHPQDFANLVDVYLDAVFFPLLTPASFDREGWHLARDGALQGVVLNEMKGIFAAPHALLTEWSRQSLFANGPYSHCYGGAPSRIPDLTHDALCAFHGRHYHPSNALVAFSGVSDIASELARLAAVFDAFEARTPDRLAEGRAGAAPQSLSLGHPAAANASLSLNWAFAVPADPTEKLACEVLCELLLGGPFAPLRRALVESNLCAEVTDSGFRDDSFPPRMTICLDSVDPAKAAQIEQHVVHRLNALMCNGLDEGLVAAALNTVEFRRADRGDAKRPHAIGLLVDAAKAWRLGRDPAEYLAFEESFARLRAKPARYFEGLIDTQLLQNAHRARVLLKPAPTASADCPAPAPKPQRAAKETVVASRAKPRAVPRLALREIARTATPDPMIVDSCGPVPLLFHPCEANGLLHLDLAFDFSGVPSMPLAPLLGRIILRAATSRHSAGAMAHRIGSLTGGLSTDCLSRAKTDGADPALRLILHGRAFPERADELFDICAELLCDSVLPDPTGLAEIVAQEISRVQARVLPRAHDMIDLRLRCRFDAAGHASEQTCGLSYLTFLYAFRARLSSEPDRAVAMLQDLRALLICRDRLVVSMSAGSAAQPRLATLAARLADRLAPCGGEAVEEPSRVALSSEAFQMSGPTHHVGVALDMRQTAWPTSGALAVAGRYLETGWLRQKLRDEGGAYGALCRTDPLSGVLTCLSYRDPRLLATIEVIRKAGGHLAQIAPDEMTQAIIATIGTIDSPLSPPASAHSSMSDWLCGWTATHRQAYRDEILGIRPSDLSEMGEALNIAAESAKFVVFAAPEAITQALSERPGLFEPRALPTE